jgi:hypothetical protein
VDIEILHSESWSFRYTPLMLERAELPELQRKKQHQKKLHSLDKDKKESAAFLPGSWAGY